MTANLTAHRTAPENSGAVRPVGRLRAPLAVGALALTLLTGCTATSGPDLSTTTPPATDPGPSPAEIVNPTVVGLVASFGNCDKSEGVVAKMVTSWSPAAVVTAGGNTQDANDCTPFTQSVNDYYADYLDGPDGPRFFPALDASDYDNPGAGLDAYQAAFPYLNTSADPSGRWYEQSLERLHFYVLDSQVKGKDLEQQKTWLKDALTAAGGAEAGAWDIVVVADPPFSSASTKAPLTPDSGWDFKGWGADLVIGGHERIFEDVVVDDLHYVTAGVGAGAKGAVCPTTLVAGSEKCVDGPGAIRLLGTTDVLAVEYHQPKGSKSTIAHTITLQR